MKSNNKELDKARRLLHDGQLHDAYRLCAAVVHSDPGNADAWFILSTIQLRAGRLGDAVSSATRAGELSPEHPEYLIHVGTCLAANSKFTDAMTVAEKALRLDISAPAILSNLGTLFSMCGDHLSAADCFMRAIRGDGDNPGYWYNLASVQRMLGELDKAEESCNKAISLNPNDGQAHYLRSDLSMQSSELNHIAELKSLVSASGQSAKNQMLGGFALAKELEDVGNYEESFSFLQRATQSFRKSIKYKVSDDIDVIEQIIAKHNKEALKSTSPGYEGDAPVFVVGLPRSGTTLAERIVQSHSQVISVGERNDFALEMSSQAAAKCASTRPSRNELVAAALGIDMAVLGRAYCDRIRSGTGDVARIIDKMPINYLYCGLIHAALPGAQVVALMRDPMDSCYAAYKAFLSGPYSFTYDLEELGRYYLAFRRLMAHWRSTLPGTNYLEVQYETLVGDFEKETRRIFEFLNLPWESEVLAFQESGTASATASAVQVRRGIYSSSVGKWKNYAKELEPLRQILAQELDAI